MKNSCVFPKIFLLLFMFVAGTYFTGLAQSDTTYWYENGLPNYWYYQPDVFAFKCLNGADYFGNLDSNVVINKIYRSDRRDSAVEIYINPLSTQQDIQQLVLGIWNSGQLKYVYPAITKNPIALYSAGQYYLVDDLIMVKFADPYIDSLTIANFMSTYNLKKFQFPEHLPTTEKHYYTFQLPEPSEEDFIAMARWIRELSSGIVEEVVPNIVNYTMGDMSEPFEVDNGDDASSVNYTDINCADLDDKGFILNTNGWAQRFGTWHITNPQFTFNTNCGLDPTSTAGADAKICDCWDMGLTGSGVRIAVIGEGIPPLTNHPDLVNLDRIALVDCSSGVCNIVNDFSTPAVYSTDLWNLISVMAAEPYNGYGTVGVAPKAKYMIIKTGTTPGSSTSQAIKAAFQLINKNDYNIDIAVTNIATTLNHIAVANEINSLCDNGRANPAYDPIFSPASPNIGMSIIASTTGKANFSTTGGSTQDIYPAAYEKVIGVIGSTPNDTKKEFNDGWGAVCTNEEDVNYGTQYDIAAPGSLVYCSNINYLNNSYTTAITDKSRNIAPGVVAGVVAMILENNYYLDRSYIVNILRTSADKVTYNYTNGLSTEFAYGRVNCGAAINSSPISSVSESISAQSNIYINEYQELIMNFTGNISSNIGTLTLTDMLGRTILSQSIQILPNKIQAISLPSNLTKGLYIANIYTNYQLYTQKIIL